MTGGGVEGFVSGATGAAGVTALVADGSCESKSAIFSINAARAAACAGVSSARTETKARQKTPMPIAGNILEICIPISYAKLSPDAIAFASNFNCFCHVP
jgi:hypothetical protein